MGMTEVESELELARKDVASRLERRVYLDHAGSALYTSRQVDETAEALKRTLLGNPRSGGDLANRSMQLLDASRRRVLKFFGASSLTHSVIFTGGATSSFSFIGNYMPWAENSGALLVSDCHQSLLSVKDLAASSGAAILVLAPADLQRYFQSGKALCENVDESSFLLFGFPGECNFTGSKFNLSMSKLAKSGSFAGFSGKQVVCVVDGAKLAATAPVSLDSYPDIDILVVSFYKIFGYPTGLGAAIVRKNSLAETLLRKGKSYFGGGTVDAYAVDDGFIQRRRDIETLCEDGGVNLQALYGLHAGFDQIERIGGMSVVAEEVKKLSSEARRRLVALKHTNGRRLIEILSDERDGTNDLVYASTGAGSVFSMLVRNSEGAPIGHKTVEKYASLEGICLRSGCMCNPGVCHRLLKLSVDDVRAHFKAGHVCGDEKDVINGRAVGAVRISFGYLSTHDDVDRIVNFFSEHFLEYEEARCEEGDDRLTEMEIVRMVIYPVKGLAGMDVRDWTVTKQGLKHDRAYSVVERGVLRAVSLKRNGRMALVRAVVDESGQDLRLQVDEKLAAELEVEPSIRVYLGDHPEQEVRKIRVCGTFEEVKDVGEPKLWNWLARVLKADVRIARAVRQLPNEEALLVVGRYNVRLLNAKLEEEGKPSVHEDVFRGNVYVETTPSDVVHLKGDFATDRVQMTSVKACVRCPAVNVDSLTGLSREDSEPLRTLTRQRSKFEGKVVFGELFALEDEEAQEIRIGDTFRRT